MVDQVWSNVGDDAPGEDDALRIAKDELDEVRKKRRGSTVPRQAD